MSKAVERVEMLARPIIEAMGLELVDVEYISEGGQRYLRLYIDKEGGVSLDDCEAVSRAVEPKLDAEDPIPERYTFEVSSPGVERPLKRDTDFTRFAGSTVQIRTFAPVEGQRTWIGRLLGLEDGAVHLELQPQGKQPARRIAIPRSQIAKANLHLEF